MISYKIQSVLNGLANIPGDKSISHRSIIIPSISKGTTKIKNILKSEDVLHTLNAFREMGVDIKEDDNKVIINGKGLSSLKKPNKEIYLGNSGTSARLLTGLLASQDFNSVLSGDDSLSSRPMNRIAEPLSLMNAVIKTNNGKLPLTIEGAKLKNSIIDIIIPSAQIKSGVLLAALNTEGLSIINEHHMTRDHTEIMLKSFGANIEINNKNNIKVIKIEGKKELVARDIKVPSDLSSSAFFIVAALINKNSYLHLKNINTNPTRNGILIALEKMGAKLVYSNKRLENDEEVCDIEVFSSELQGCELDSSIAKLMIDEYPILSIAAVFANTPSVFRGLKELRVKESDRLELIRLNLINCGVNCKVINDDLYIEPIKQKVHIAKKIRTDYDHRIAMAFAVMGTRIGPISIDDSSSIKTSFPTFKDEMNKIGGNII